MRRTTIAAALIIASSIFLWTGTASVHAAQKKGRSSLTGVVLDAAGKPVPNAVVTYQSGGGHTAHAVRTDAQGRFTIHKLRWDNYDLRASTKGRYSDWEKNVMLRSGQQKSVTLRLTGENEPLKTSVKEPR